MNLLRHSRNKFVFILFFSWLLVNCSSKEKQTKEIVRVNDAVLTVDELEHSLNSIHYGNKYKEQFINEWIEKEILYQKAFDEGLLNNDDFNYIIDRSKKELAAAFLKKKVVDENYIEPTLTELRNYYENYNEDFRLVSESYRINMIHFSDFDKAVQFRNILLESDWDRAVNVFRGETAILSFSKDIVVGDYQLYPAHLQIITGNLLAGEVSVVLETEPSKFTIVQLIDKLKKNEIPPFEAIISLVKERYIIIKQNEVVREFIKKLKDDYNVEIIRY